MHPWNENKGAAGLSNNSVACMGSPYWLAWAQCLMDLICTYTYAHTTIVNGSHHPICPIQDDRDYVTLGITGPHGSPKHSLDFFCSLCTSCAFQKLDLHQDRQWASNLSLCHKILDKLKDFLQCAWTCELACGVHLALVKTVIDEMLLESDYVIAKLKVNLHPGFLSLVTFNWASQAERAIFEVLTIAKDAMTTHACHLVVHGKSVHHSLHLLESISLDILSLLATELASVNQEKEEIKCRVSTIFGMQCGSLCILKG
ncbi:hypothetical protein F5148DRAFT_1147408 [Russula earlei]|uniref:Uncharacterized protein n=1 Tax=Russula earlei TaxID=71964 RepID=A0ACC0UFV7_9AGAM|nr:hypothetical protein F5148DRAFT_1147408 [Russula earlei]